MPHPLFPQHSRFARTGNSKFTTEAIVLREITILKVMNGFVVRVGCQAVVFESASGLLEVLAKYIDDPTTIEREWIEKYNPGKGYPADQVDPPIPSYVGESAIPPGACGGGILGAMNQATTTAAREFNNSLRSINRSRG